MKALSILILSASLLFTPKSSDAYAFGEIGPFCDIMHQGGDAWPWSVAKPFPWSNVAGYWELMGTESTEMFMKAQVLSTTSDRKFLSISFYKKNICSKTPYAKGTGYIDITEKNVVTALLSDGVYRYQMKLGLFNTADLAGGDYNLCGSSIMAASIQVIERLSPFSSIRSDLSPSVSASLTDTQKVMLKKVTDDPATICKKK